MNYILKKSCKSKVKVLHRCAFTSSSALHNSPEENAKSLIKKQLEFDANLPKAKSWSNTAVLHALADTISNAGNIDYQEFESASVWFDSGYYSAHLKHASRSQGRATANYIIENYSNLFQHDWGSESVERWVDNTGEDVVNLDKKIDNDSTLEIESGQSEASTDNPFNHFWKLVNEKEIDNSITEFFRLSNDNVKIPQELLNQFFGLISFYRGSSAFFTKLQKYPNWSFYASSLHESKLTISNRIKDLYQLCNSSLTLDQLSTKLLALTNEDKDNCHYVVSHYKDKLQDHKLDIEVYNYLLLCLKDSKIDTKLSFAKEILKTMKHQEVKPNYETFVCFAQIVPSDVHSTENLLEFIEQVLGEMKEIGIEPGVAVFSSLMSTAMRSNIPDQLLLQSAILDYMFNNISSTLNILDVGGLRRIVTFCKNSLILMKKLFHIFQQPKLSFLMSSNIKMAHDFYWSFLCSLLKDDTLDNVFVYIQLIIPSKINFDSDLRKMVLHRICEERRLEYLPIFLLYLPPGRHLYYIDLIDWLEAALSTIEDADEDTIIQFRHIAMMEIKLSSNNSYHRNFQTVVNKLFDLLLETAENYNDVSSTCEILLEKKKACIEPRLLSKLERFGVQHNKSLHVKMIINNLEKMRVEIEKSIKQKKKHT